MPSKRVNACLFKFFLFFLICITACVRICSGKTEVPRTVSMAKVFSVMCCSGLVPMVLWCWCCWCPARWPLHQSLLLPIWCAQQLRLWNWIPLLWTVFRENITDKEFPHGALNGILYFCASLGEGAGVDGEAVSGVQRANMYFRVHLYFQWW